MPGSGPPGAREALSRWLAAYFLLASACLLGLSLQVHSLCQSLLGATPEGMVFWVAHTRADLLVHRSLAIVLALALAGLVGRTPKQLRFPVLMAGAGPIVLMLTLSVNRVLETMLA